MSREVTIHHGSMLDWLATYDGPLFDSCVTDPPYHLTSIVKRFGGANAAEAKVGATGAYARASRGFMGKEWDGGDVAFRPETWRAVYDKLKPGAHLVAFSGTRTYHRMACAIEDAGFEIRDQLQWLYGQGFPKSHDVSKGIDRQLGVEDQREITHYKGQGPRSMFDGGKPRPASLWNGWGTALKPACEPICLARKPLSEKSIAANVLKHGTGGINVDGCRVGMDKIETRLATRESGGGQAFGCGGVGQSVKSGVVHTGRWPANILHDGSDEVLAGFPDTGAGSDAPRNNRADADANVQFTSAPNGLRISQGHADNGGSAARFFYSAKAGPLDRIGATHATVKPVDVMRWLCRLVTPPGGLILEPFAGSGTTGIAAMAEGFDCTMIELEADHVADIERKLAYLRGEGSLSFVEHDRQRATHSEQSHGPLFA